MRIKANELKGAALDWAVACATNGSRAFFDAFGARMLGRSIVKEVAGGNIHPSTGWSQGGPLIDELVHSFNRWNDGTYEANVKTGACTAIGCEGDTILIAAMRAIVASEIGDEVDIPEELVS